MSSAPAVGLIGGYLGGWWDELVSFVGNVLLSFPVMVLFILVLNVLGQSGFNIIIAVTCSSAPVIMRIVRGLALDARSRDYIQAAQTRGEHPLWIMLVELLPNVRGPLIVDACLRLGYTTVAITTLTFLGLGLQPPDPDWGLMIKEAAHRGAAVEVLLHADRAGAGGVEPDPGLQSDRRRPARNEPSRWRAIQPDPGADPRMPQSVGCPTPAAAGDVPAVTDFNLALHARRGARAGGRVRLRQVDGRARHHAPSWAPPAASSRGRSCSRAATS